MAFLSTFKLTRDFGRPDEDQRSADFRSRRERSQSASSTRGRAPDVKEDPQLWSRPGSRARLHPSDSHQRLDDLDLSCDVTAKSRATSASRRLINDDAQRHEAQRRSFTPTRHSRDDHRTRSPERHSQNNDDRDYCIIKSAKRQKSAKAVRTSHPGNSRSNFAKSVQNSRGNTFVLTADTASLLLQSGPPMVVRSATDLALGRRQASTSVIQSVSDANSAVRPQSRVAGKGRGNDFRKSSPYRVASRHQKENGGGYLYGEIANILYQTIGKPYRSYSNIDLIRAQDQARSKSTSLLASRNYQSEDTLNKAKSAVVGNRTNSEFLTGGAGKTLRDVNTRQSKADKLAASLNTHERSSTNISRPSTNDPNENNMASRRTTYRADVPMKTQRVKANGKTLMPSKHGFHPRSHSPTFKRLCGAMDKLRGMISTKEDTHSSVSVNNCLPVSVFEEHTYRQTDYSSSSDSVAGMRLMGEGILDDFIDSDNRSSDSSSFTSQIRVDVNYKNKIAPRRPQVNRYSHHKYDSQSESEEADRPSRVRQPRQQHRLAPNRRHTNSLDRANMPHERVIIGRLDDPPAIQEDFRGDGYGGESENIHSELESDYSFQHQDMSSGVEIVSSPRNVQPTQLHFFLPQLADGSEVSGPVTNRSHFMEQRLELMSRNEPTSQPPSYDVDKNKSNGNSKQRNPTIAKPQQKGRTQSKERVTASGIRNGHLTLNNGYTNNQINRQTNISVSTMTSNGRQSPTKDEVARSKRQASPVRVGNKVEKAVGRRRPNYAREQPVYIETSMPGEILKKKMENFPTLVSMDFADSESPWQVR